MFKKLSIIIASLVLSTGLAFAEADVNKADQAGLDAIKGIGAATATRILDERKKGGAFKDWTDLQTRVKGIGEKNALKLSQAGLTVNGQAKTGAKAAAPAATGAKAAPAKAPAK